MVIPIILLESNSNHLSAETSANRRYNHPMPAGNELVQINGALGEGGGQILRSSLTLSILSRRGFVIQNIRQARGKPGLMAQHLAAVDAAAKISAAQVDGASLGSTELRFIPAAIRSGRYRFCIRTAGSACLVLQTVLLPLSRAGSASSFQISGGTHVPWSPCYHYLEQQWLPYLRRIGIHASLTLDRSGYYPQGGGQISGVVRPAGNITPLILEERGRLLGIEGISAVSNLKREIAERQKRQATGRLLKFFFDQPLPSLRIRLEELPSTGKGTLLLLKATFENGSGCFFGLGEIGKPAERVADLAVDELLGFMETTGPIDAYLADQLLLPLALADGPSRLRTPEISAHLLSNAAALEAFLPGRVNILGEPGSPGTIEVNPRS